MKPQKAEGDKYSPTANTFILSESVFHISDLNKRSLVCWTSTITIMIKNIKKELILVYFKGM